MEGLRGSGFKGFRAQGGLGGGFSRSTFREGHVSWVQGPGIGAKGADAGGVWATTTLGPLAPLLRSARHLKPPKSLPFFWRVYFQ